MLTNEVRVVTCVILLLFGEAYGAGVIRNKLKSMNSEVTKENASNAEKRQGYPGLGALNYGGTYGNFGPTSGLLPGEMGFMDVDGFEGIIEPGKSAGLTGMVKSLVKTQKKRIEEIKKIAKQTKTMIQEQFKLIKKKPVIEEPVPVFSGQLATPYIPPPPIAYNPLPPPIPLAPLQPPIPFNPLPQSTYGLPPPPTYDQPLPPPIYGQSNVPQSVPTY